MTSKNVQKRNEKAQSLRVIAVDKGTFFVESEEGKICYRVELNSYGASCTCGDYAKNSRQDENFHNHNDIIHYFPAYFLCRVLLRFNCMP